MKWFIPDAALIGNGFILESRAAGLTTNIPASVNAVTTCGYATKGDGGGGLYKRVAVQPTHIAKFQSADGAWWEYVKVDDIVNILALGADPTGAVDCSTISNQAADFASPNTLVYPKGTYLHNSPLNILKTVTLDFSQNQAVFLMGTQNMNGIVIGDNTEPTKGATYFTTILYPTFNYKSGVAQSTSGYCIKRNYVAFCNAYGVNIYGKADNVRKIYGGIYDYKATECDSPYLVIQEIHGHAITCEGANNPSSGVNPYRTVDCNYDFARLLGIDGNAFNILTNTAGLGAFRPISYGVSGYSVYLNAVQGPDGQQYFFTDVDFEIGALGGFNIVSGQRVIARGGWIGGPTASGYLYGVNLSALTDTCEFDLHFATCMYKDLGTANTVTGEFSGDNVTAGTGITLGGPRAVVKDGTVIRQWNTAGIAFQGNPNDCYIGACSYANNTIDIAALSGWTDEAAPVILQQAGSVARTGYTAAATVAVPITTNWAQITGGTAIQNFPLRGSGQMLTIQAGAGGIQFTNGGNIVLPTSPLNVAAFMAVTFVCNGTNYFRTV